MIYILACDGGCSNVRFAEVVHRSGIGPEGGDCSIAVEHALVGASHRKGCAISVVGAGQVPFADIGGRDGCGTEKRRGTDAARIGADARGELCEVGDVRERCLRWRKICNQDFVLLRVLLHQLLIGTY